MTPPIEHEYSSCVAYTRDLELYTAWVEQKLAEAHPDPRVAELESVLRECLEALEKVALENRFNTATLKPYQIHEIAHEAIAKIDEALK